MGEEHTAREWLEAIYHRLGKVQNNQAIETNNQHLLGDQFSELRQFVTTEMQQLKDLIVKIRDDCGTIQTLRAKIVALEAQLANTDAPADVQARIDELKQIDNLILAAEGGGTVAGIQIEHGTPTERTQ
jgi:1-aminocyclopropane-1-carboxylate deaminase/D-cysteine desulfhydrase-like pyridoxal-dependent ACC family enzyme